MKLSKPLSLAVVAITLIGVLAVDSSSAQSRAPAYMIIEYEITDQAEFREYQQASAALRALAACRPLTQSSHAN
jgi:hypothetical protein